MDAVFMAGVFTHLGFIGHDAGRRQIFNSTKSNDMVLLGLCLLLGTSRGWWLKVHNEHHANPNNLELDPHTRIPFFAFSPKQWLAKTPVLRFVTRYQAFYFFPLLFLEGFGIKLASVLFLANHSGARYRLEKVAFATHLVAYVALLLLVLNPWQAGLFALVHTGLVGLYNGLVFAPNHKGMPIVENEYLTSSWEMQIRTARNIRFNRFVSLLLGGLDKQIEHHLFSQIPRNQLKHAGPFVKKFCEEQGIPYCETGLGKSYALVIDFLWKAPRAA